jgi:hypothetical protein
MSLILWKAPVVYGAEEAEALLEPWYDRGDDSAFEASEDIARYADALRRRFPDDPSTESPDEGSPWADLPFEQSERLLFLSLRWSAGDDALDAIADLAHEHGLVLYDPQGPDIHVPDDDPMEEDDRPARPADYVRFALFGLVSAGLLALGFWLTVPVLDVLLRVAGGFLTAVFLFVLVRIMLARPE